MPVGDGKKTECAWCSEDVDMEIDCCIDGIIYGYCASENCGGLCEPEGDCDCTCHQSPVV